MATNGFIWHGERQSDVIHEREFHHAETMRTSEMHVPGRRRQGILQRPMS
jgi:hypothetical protein